MNPFTIWRHFLAILLLPFMVVVVIPRWMMRGWALSDSHWAVVFFLIFEEPDLERRFGEDYRRYKANVPRWIPRRTPWNG